MTAIRASIPAATATLNAQGISISAAEFNNRVTLKDVPQTRLISVQCTSRSFDMPLAMVNALIIPYRDKVGGVSLLPGTIRRSTTNAWAGAVLGAAMTGLIITLSWRRLVR